MDETMILNIEEGLIILFVGIGIVFIALLLLYLVFQYVVPLGLSLAQPSPRSTPEESGTITHEKRYDSADEIAAVTAAVNLFLEEIHDEENPIVTINKSIKDYSPWSSKIYVTHNVLRTTGKR